VFIAVPSWSVKGDGGLFTRFVVAVDAAGSWSEWKGASEIKLLEKLAVLELKRDEEYIEGGAFGSTGTAPKAEGSSAEREVKEPRGSISKFVGTRAGSSGGGEVFDESRRSAG